MFLTYKNNSARRQFFLDSQVRMPPYHPPSKSDKWQTPPPLFAKLNAEFHFNHDPCPITWAPGDADGLTTEWGPSTFCNPPYSNTGLWIKKAHDEWKKGKTVVMLINCVTDTIAFHEFIYGKAELRFIKGRISFINPAEPAKRAPSPKPSMLVVFRAPPETARI